MEYTLELTRLATLVPPPEEPLFADATPYWAKNLAALGFELPADTLPMSQLYGRGRFVGTFLEVLHPLSEDYLTRVAECGQCVRGGDENPAYPSVPGLLPWASDESGNTYCWYTQGATDAWPIVVDPHGNSSGAEGLYRYQMSVPKFLVAMFQNELPSVWFGQPYERDELSFTPTEW